jgi:hypothetical protein
MGSRAITNESSAAHGSLVTFNLFYYFLHSCKTLYLNQFGDCYDV